MFTSLASTVDVPIQRNRQRVYQFGGKSLIGAFVAIEIELFLCLIEKISMVSNSQREDQGMPVIMEILAISGKASMLRNT